MFRDGQRRHQPDVPTAIWHLSLFRFLVCLFFTHKMHGMSGSVAGCLMLSDVSRTIPLFMCHCA